jgi:hypothetical protein
VSREQGTQWRTTTRCVVKAPPRKATSTSTPRCDNAPPPHHTHWRSQLARDEVRALATRLRGGQCEGVGAGETQVVLGGCEGQLLGGDSNTHCWLRGAVGEEYGYIKGTTAFWLLQHVCCR